MKRNQRRRSDRVVRGFTPNHETTLKYQTGHLLSGMTKSQENFKPKSERTSTRREAETFTLVGQEPQPRNSTVKLATPDLLGREQRWPNMSIEPASYAISFLK
jgi:hypothetical protein